MGEEGTGPFSRRFLGVDWWKVGYGYIFKRRLIKKQLNDR